MTTTTQPEGGSNPWTTIQERNRQLEAENKKLRERLKQLQKFDAALYRARRALLGQMVRLMPKAVADAKLGKPALLRLISRTLK